MLFLKRRVLLQTNGDAVRVVVATETLRKWSGGKFRLVAAAGTKLRPRDSETLRELGVRSKNNSPPVPLEDVAGKRFHCVITLCDCEHETCPKTPSTAQHILWDIGDPKDMSGNAGEPAMKRWRERVDRLAYRFMVHGQWKRELKRLERIVVCGKHVAGSYYASF
jgi:ArsR family transcriptional regulator, arsenate/arsenite/antimonite-responsive transcriptional repressor / arsenate reductase (thioredoxin)